MNDELPMSTLLEGNALRRWARGFTYPFRGIGWMLSNPKLWPFVMAPALITLALIGMSAVVCWLVVPYLVTYLWDPHEGWAWWMWWGLMIGLSLATFSVSLVVFYFASGVIAIPFNDRLSERVETMTLGPRSEPFSLEQLRRDIAQSVRHSLASLSLWAVIMVLLLMLHLIPVIGSVVNFVLSTLVTGFFVARETMDGAMSRRRLAFRHKVRIVLAHKSLMLGLGMATAMLLWIPLLNFISLPVAVIGGTLLFCRLELDRALPGPDDDTPYLPPPRNVRQIESLSEAGDPT